jgi:hypothetical protein
LAAAFTTGPCDSSDSSIVAFGSNTGKYHIRGAAAQENGDLIASGFYGSFGGNAIRMDAGRIAE